MVDLHLHTTASDGSSSPTELVMAAARLGLTAIAVADHDSVAGVKEAVDAGKSVGVEVIPAIEMSSEADSRIIHFLAYFIDYENDDLQRVLSDLREARFARAQKIVDRLNKLGVDIDMDEVLVESAGGAVGRAHVARALAARGSVPTIRDAFSLHLAEGKPAYVSKLVLEPLDVINKLHAAGGLVSLAHPALSQADDLIDEFISYGLDAIEAYHSEHTAEQIEHYIRLAKDKNLLVTGGSDCHGERSSRGIKLGEAGVPDSVLEDLRNEWLHRQ